MFLDPKFLFLTCLLDCLITAIISSWNTILYHTDLHAPVILEFLSCKIWKDIL